MKLAILGAGNVGTTLGRGWLRAGHQVTYGVREPDGAKARTLVQQGAGVKVPRAAAAAADAVVLATPWSAVPEVVADLGDLAGRPLLDATNPIGPGLRLLLGHEDSGAERIQRWAPSARVVKVFNTVGVEVMADPAFGSHAATMLYCGDDDPACSVAHRLAIDLGFEAVAAGPLRNARLLEPLGMLWIDLALVRGHGREIAFTLQRRHAVGSPPRSRP
jgi:8-hydroxy-5-deazaflavin:NADPH oxidoreductase